MSWYTETLPFSEGSFENQTIDFIYFFWSIMGQFLTKKGNSDYWELVSGSIASLH